MNMNRQMTVIGLTLGVFGCSGGQGAVRPDQMSAEAHQREAAKDREAARNETQQANSPTLQPNMTVTGGSNPQGYYAYPAEMYDPRSQYLARAQQLSKHAQEHEAAAASLEKFEQAECRDFPPAIRSACPLLGPVVELVDIPGGIRARFKDGVRVDAVVAHMRCHFAYAQARGFDTAAGCPLYVRGIDIRRASDPGAVEIVGRDPAVTSEIRSRARDEALLVHARN